MAHPSYHDYEAQLAEQRARIKIEGDEVVARLSRMYRFPLSSSDTLEHAIDQSRTFALCLLEAKEDFYHLPIRLMELAAEFHGWRVDCSELYMQHSIIELPRIAKIGQRNTNGRHHIEFSSEDGYFFLELSRALKDDEPFGTVHVEWPKIGYGADKERKFGEISFLDIQRTLEHLVFSFSPDTKWDTTRPTKEDNQYYWERGTRLALAVHWDDRTQEAAVEAIGRLMRGLPYTGLRDERPSRTEV